MCARLLPHAHAHCQKKSRAICILPKNSELSNKTLPTLLPVPAATKQYASNAWVDRGGGEDDHSGAECYSSALQWRRAIFCSNKSLAVSQSTGSCMPEPRRFAFGTSSGHSNKAVYQCQVLALL
eukprot:4237588-Pleurochrysis_carterae.AAC.1